MHSELDPSLLDGHQQEKIRRIHIIGVSGSGKTTLSRTLATTFDLPTYHLDDLRAKHSNEAGNHFKLLSADVSSIASSDAWITEGVYLGWTEELLHRADLIIWLDFPWHLATWQQLVRFVWFGLTKPSSRSVLQKVALLYHFLFRYVMGGMKYYLDSTNILMEGAIQDTNAKNRASTKHCLASYDYKLIRLRKPSDIDVFLASLK